MEWLSKIYDISKCVIIFVYLLYGFATTEADEGCELPNGARGVCVELAACAQYVALLKESTTTAIGLRLAQDRRCGHEGNNPKVCCPTLTEVPDPTNRMNFDKSDYVDELPKPGVCGVHEVHSEPAVWNGEPVDNRDEPSKLLQHIPSIPALKHLQNTTRTRRDAEYSESLRFSIYEGSPVRSRAMAKWMALLAYKSSPSLWECGGSIITERHVLTAAHCIRESLFVVRIGELDLAKPDKEFSPIDFYIKKKIRHEQYTKYHNDIAVLVLDGTIPIKDPFFSNYIGAVCLPEPNFPDNRDGPQTIFITGWGETEKQDRPTNLLYAYLKILEQDVCRSVYSDKTLTIDDRVFCAGDLYNARDACNGDSGGPLLGSYFIPGFRGVIIYYQLGLISFGYRCSAQRYTGVYTNITHFMPWIREKVTGRSGPRS